MTEQPFLTVPHGQLLDALELIGGVAHPRPPVPVMGGVLITAHADGTAAIDSFDYETHVHLELDGGQREVRVLLDRKMLTGYVKSLLVGTTRARAAGTPVHLATSDTSNLAVISAQGYRFTALLLPEADYPALPPYEVEHEVTVSRDTLLRACTRLSTFTGDSKTVPMLTGINFAAVDGGLELVATDRFRLGVDFVPTVEGGKLGGKDVDLSWLLSGDHLVDILKRLPGGPCTLSFCGVIGQGGWIRFSSGPTVVSVRWMENEFVKYRPLLRAADNAARTADVVIDREKLDIAVRRAAAAIDRSRHIRLSFADESVTVSGGDLGPDSEGSATSPPIPLEQDGEVDWPISFTASFVTRALSLYPTDSVSIRLVQPNKPILIAEPGLLDDDHAFRALVMPARTPSS